MPAKAPTQQILRTEIRRLHGVLMDMEHCAGEECEEVLDLFAEDIIAQLTSAADRIRQAWKVS